MIILILFYNVYGMKRQKRFKNCQFLCDSWGILEKSTSSVSCTLIQFCVQVPIEGTANVLVQKRLARGRSTQHLPANTIVAREGVRSISICNYTTICGRARDKNTANAIVMNVLICNASEDFQRTQKQNLNNHLRRRLDCSVDDSCTSYDSHRSMSK